VEVVRIVVEVVAEISLAYQTLHPPSPQCALKVEEFWL
jgi:hypothetical protein